MINLWSRKSQTGLVLLTSLALLLLLSLLATASLHLVNLNALLANHHQSAHLTQQFAQNIINELLANISHFTDQKTATDPAELEARLQTLLQATASVDQSALVTGELVSINCLAEQRLNGCSIDTGGQCASRYYWELRVRASHASSLAQSEITQGFSFDYLPGYCPQ